MKIAFKIGRLLLVNFLVVVGLILVTMLPRETNQVELNQFSVKYIFSSQVYFSNVYEFAKERIQTLSLGETWDRTSVFDDATFYYLNSLSLLFISLFIAIVIGLFGGIKILKIRPGSQKGEWFKVPNFFLLIPLVYAVSEIASLQSLFFLSLLIAVYPSVFIAKLVRRSLINSSKTFIVNCKIGIQSILQKMSKITVIILSNLVIVEFLTEFKGAGYTLVKLVDFSTEPFSRLNRSYEYELIITLLVAFICTIFIAQWIEFLAKKYLTEDDSHWGWLIFSHLAIFLGAVILMLFPRGAAHDFAGIVYIFSFDTYKENINGLVNSIVFDFSLGKTKTGFIVEEEIARYFPRSLKIVFAAFVISVCVGIVKGFFDFKYQNKWYSFIGRGTTWLTSAIPDFFLIILLQWIILVNFPFIDILGYEKWYNFIIPALLISIHPIMYIANITREAISDENGEQYVLVAFSKGLSRDRVILKHIFKNAIVAICNHLPSVMLYIMSNLLIIEWLLDYKGAAYRLFKAVEFSNMIAVKGGLATKEAPLIFGFLLCFMIPLILAQVLSIITKYKFNKVGRE